MDVATIYSRALAGVTSPLVTVEIHLTRGLPGLAMVGLPETAVRESRERVRSAIVTNHFEFPRRRIIINLAPADLPKEGGRFDLSIAVGILAASGQIPADSLRDYEFLGELALTGSLRPVRGILPVALATRRTGRKLVLPQENAAEAALIRTLEVLPAGHLLDVCAHLIGRRKLTPHDGRVRVDNPAAVLDMADVRGQYNARRALEIAAAGRHNILMFGPPGSGKTMLAERLPGIMPTMTEEQAIESAAVASLQRGGVDLANWQRRPFRAPHHTASAVALVGGGNPPRPGEISLAHHGVLFLDELTEFQRRVLEVLREPLESGRIVISRASHQVEFPADFQLVAAMNPCPCGYFGDQSGRCRCSEEKIESYRARISGPLLDRIEIQLEIPNIGVQAIQTPAAPSTASAVIRQRVQEAFAIQMMRAGKPSGMLSHGETRAYCRLDGPGRGVLENAVKSHRLSARAVHRTLKVARTIADLEAAPHLQSRHVLEALGYRQLDRLRSIC